MSQYAILTLIRHGETTGNLNRLLQGVTDSPLTVFGQAQVDALARTWATTVRETASQECVVNVHTPKKESPISTLDLPPPTLIVCSPIGRARKTAQAIHRACVSQGANDGEVLEDLFVDASSSPPSSRLDVASTYSPRLGLSLVVDKGLAEKDFGWKESTRGGVHVAGFPKGHGAGESRLDFTSKVKKVGLEWLQAASHLTSSPPGTEETKTPHIVLVSHGMWISTFLSVLPPTVITQTSGQPGFLPFAANTGMFSLRVKPRSLDHGAASALQRPETELFRANDVRHLEHVKRQKGGIGRGAFDTKQTKLSSFFATPKTQSDTEQHATSDTDGSPTKKRRT